MNTREHDQGGSPDRRELSALLRGVELFARLGDDALAVVAGHCDVQTFEAGSVIIPEGRENGALCIVRDGEILVTRDQDGQRMDLARILSGETFGELDLVERPAMTATVIADKNTTLVMFPGGGRRFHEALKEYPSIVAMILNAMLAMISGRIRSTNRLVSEKSHWIQDLKNQLWTDKLTGLYNRTYIDEELPDSLPKLGTVTTMLMVKPDNFKSINDTYGHDAGDRALRLIADTIKVAVRKGDFIVRYRGDEYLLILPGVDASTGITIANRFRKLLKKINFDSLTDGNHLDMTFSLGVAIYPDHAADCKRLVALSFKRMFIAREAGGDKICAAQ